MSEPQAEDCIEHQDRYTSHHQKEKQHGPRPAALILYIIMIIDYIYYIYLAKVCPLHKLKTASSTRTDIHPNMRRKNSTPHPQTLILYIIIIIYYVYLANVCPLHKLKTASSTRTDIHPIIRRKNSTIHAQPHSRTQQHREQQHDTHLCLCAGIIGLPRGLIT